ncbi:DUF4142 domain-containing protein [Chitinophaga rhizophila]|uniref:DUF4142 domain-containing protein n=1 Tax=Chitinophaga rhizophila TaxID=2866212 RepID=A0ABS7G514_9BACT|nr:DUF4142 domain-containing protein [Chitinophaga rhizophila]MBW8682744.1 DUF4142 domain-containing protein [Chitinophaga rhizophila]
MKKLTLAISVVCLLFACQNKEVKSQEAAREDSADAMTESMDHLDNAAVEFATTAATANLREIELGKLAQTNANYGRLKEFGQKMVTAHTQSNADLQQACYKSGVTVPTGLSAEEMKDISAMAEKKDKSFDRAFIKRMVREHQETMEKLDAAAHNMKDTALQNYAKKTLPIVSAHLEEARHILEDVRKQYAPEQFDDVESYQ